MDVLPVHRALLSVSDKEGIVPFARGLSSAGVEIVSTGSTAAALRDEGVPVTAVENVTGFPEMLGGRVKTLHPKIHAGILADKDDADHVHQLEEARIDPIDLVVVNLYPFERAVEGGASRAEAIEQIDIGGPTLIRAAAKNHGSVAVVVEAARYDEIVTAIEKDGGIPAELRGDLAEAAFSHVALYDAAIAAWFRSRAAGEEAPGAAVPGYRRLASLRYGENPHQRAALYGSVLTPGPLGGAEVLQGKEMSYNNWLDAEAARALAAAFDGTACVIVKHHNPCGTAATGSPARCYEDALASDPVSAFGGVVAYNVEVDEDAARAMAEVFTEVVIAPSYAEAALKVFAERENLRVVRAAAPEPPAWEIRPIEGGALLQEPDAVREARDDMRVATVRAPTDEEWEGLLFAWTVAARVKSNAIVLGAGRKTVGVGAGQMSRVDAVEIARRKAGDRAAGSVLASDAFFPFRDSIDAAAEAGVTAVIQPGGSVRDEEVVAAADEHGIAMVLTGIRHFRH